MQKPSALALGPTLLLALVAPLSLAMPNRAEAQVCAASIESSTTPQDSSKHPNGNNGRRRKPRIRHAPRDGTMETASVDGCGGDTTPPTVSINPSGGSFGGSVNVTVSWSDDVGLDRFGYSVTLNGVNITSRLAYTGGTYSAQA
ncbi:MAG TPA: hypothetical protein VEY93_09100, partial [Longimicrobium sp.]|nr:hypothetical protein [Longimicrobium sp.]